MQGFDRHGELNGGDRRAAGRPGSRCGAETVRWDLIRRVRREIARGSYETAEKWDVVLGKLLSEVHR